MGQKGEERWQPTYINKLSVNSREENGNKLTNSGKKSGKETLGSGFGNGVIQSRQVVYRRSRRSNFFGRINIWGKQLDFFDGGRRRG